MDISHKAAAELRKVAGRSTETYTAYGVTEQLFKQCAAQANYAIPQASDSNAEMPKTADGEDLGVGSGWWHTGMAILSSTTRIALPHSVITPWNYQTNSHQNSASNRRSAPGPK
jgi:hypothetical protein